MINTDGYIYRLEKRKQAMLAMPQMIQTWKEVRLRCYFVLKLLWLMMLLERTWPWMEKMAEISSIFVERFAMIERVHYSLLYRYIAGSILCRGLQRSRVYLLRCKSNSNCIRF